MRPKRSKDKELDIERIIRDFEESESSSGHRKGSFKVKTQFDEAIKKILKAKPEPKKTKKEKP